MVGFAKGHGTRNDFVLLSDPDDTVGLTDGAVRFLCDRRGGIGGDGVLRAVRGRHIDGWTGDPEVWFMDYRNADGSVAEMCGNGLRVFARYLVEEGLVPAGTTSIPIGTRAGPRDAELLRDGRVRVWMGRPQLGDTSSPIRIDLRRWMADPVWVGNPHAVVILDRRDRLDQLDLSRPPVFEAEHFPQGVNIEFVEIVGERHVRMRVHERGVGETESCGTGTVAVAVATAYHEALEKQQTTWRIDVPGGTVEVTLRGRQAWLTGPAEIVARGEIAWPKEAE
ncbi:MAG: diaminopimelate epimerase [Propionibacteriaceae bacterium]|nr:diaminopimelate epimerase [Propionibacteriaceae bacterium]